MDDVHDLLNNFIMAINQTIGKFIQTAGGRDFQRNNLFRIMSLKTRNLSLTEEDLVYAKGAKIPSRETPVGDNVKYMGMTLPYTKSTVSYPGNTAYDITFYVDAKNELAQKFERASRLGFNDLSTTGDWRFPTLSDEMTVVVLNNKLEPIDYIHFYGVSFVKFGEIAFDIAGGDGSSIEIPCTISYLYYKRKGSDTVYAGNA